MHRSRSRQRTKRRTPGGREVLHYQKRRPKRTHCAAFGAPLAGSHRARATALARVSKTKKRPGRAYGGQLCHQCLNTRIKAAVRGT